MPGSEEAAALFGLGLSLLLADPGKTETAHGCLSESEDLFWEAEEEDNALQVRELIDSVDWSGILAARQAPKFTAAGWGAVLGGLGGIMIGQPTLGSTLGAWVEKLVQNQPVRLAYAGKLEEVSISVTEPTAETPMLQLDVHLSVTNYLWRACTAPNMGRQRRWLPEGLAQVLMRTSHYWGRAMRTYWTSSSYPSGMSTITNGEPLTDAGLCPTVASSWGYTAHDGGLLTVTEM